jgi:hypothetical protein
MTEKKAAMSLTLDLPKMSTFRLTPTQIREFIQLIEERATTNPLYSLADRAQAVTAIPGSYGYTIDEHLEWIVRLPTE